MYLRLRHEIGDERFEPMRRNAPAWLELPFDTFPLDTSKTLVDSWSFRLKMIDIAAAHVLRLELSRPRAKP